MKKRKTIIILFISSILSIILFNAYCVKKKEAYFKKYFEFDNIGLRRFFYINTTELSGGKYTNDKIDRKISFSNKLNEEFRLMQFSIKWAGLFYAEKSGQYKFYTRSDDGSYLYIDRKIILDNGGIHPAIEKASKKIFLNKGFHYISIHYFQNLGEAEVEFYWKPVVKGLSKSNNLERNFHPADSSFDIERDESEFDKILAVRRYGNYILLWIILLIAIGHLNISFFWIKNNKITAKILSNWGRFVKRIYPRWSSTLPIFEKIINILIAIDLITIFIINLTGGIDLGISIIGLKLRATKFYRPVTLLLILVLLKIILIWKRASIWSGIKNRLSYIINLCNNPKTYKYLTLITLGAIIIFGAKLRISHYTSKAMWWDEVLVLITVKNRGIIDVIKQLSYSLHEPLYYFFVKVMYFFSRSDAVIKLPSLISGIAAIIALFYVVRKLCGRRIALISAYMLSVCVVHIKYSQMLRMYTMVILFSLLSTYMLFQFLNSRGDTKKMWGYIITTVLSLNTHILSITVFAAQIGYIFYCLIEEGTLKLLFGKKITALFILLISLITNGLLINSFSIQLGEIPLLGALSQKIPLLISFVLLLFVISISLSMLNIVFCSSTSSSPQPVINLHTLRKLALAAVLILALCPSFVKSLLHITSISPINRASSIPITFLSTDIKRLIGNFSHNLLYHRGDWIFGFYRERFFLSMFVIGIALSFMRRKKWTVLFSLYSISIYAFILIIGYNTNSGSFVAERHALLVLPAAILFTSSGLVWTAESIFNIFIYPLRPLMNSAIRPKITLAGKNIFAITLASYVFMSGWDADSGNIDDWYSERWQDWFTYGRFINESLRPGILFFFPDTSFQHHASAYVNKESEYLIFHPSNSSLDKRTIWVTNCFENPENIKKDEKLINQRFKLLIDAFSYGRIYEKEFPVTAPIIISDAKDREWIYYSDFKGYESGNENGYKFITDSHSIKNMSNRYAQLQPSVSNEPCSIIYKFVNKSIKPIKSFTLEINCSVGRASYIKIKSSPGKSHFRELFGIGEQSGTFSLDISEEIKGLDSFYLEFELFAKRLPEDFVDAFGKVGINYIRFHAVFSHELTRMDTNEKKIIK